MYGIKNRSRESLCPVHRLSSLNQNTYEESVFAQSTQIAVISPSLKARLPRRFLLRFFSF